MKDTLGRRLAGAALVAVLSLVTALSTAQSPVPVPLERAKAAVGLVSSIYEPIPALKDKDTPIARDGSWSVRAMHEGETVKACQVAETTCYVVIYRAGEPVVTCEWTVAFGKTTTEPQVVAQSATTSEKMLRVFSEKAPKAHLSSCFGSGSMVVSDAGGPTWPQNKPPIDGEVTASLIVDSKGRVVSVKAVSGPEEMRSPVANNMRLWQLKPCVVNDVAIPFVITITMRTSTQGPINANYNNNH